MKEIIHNQDNLNDNEITELVIRTKALIVNEGKLLIASANNVLQFPGGHLEEGESLNCCLKREVFEETGIKLEDSEIGDCFLKVVFKNRNWPEEGKNRKCEIYYYVINTSKYPVEANLQLTESEKEHNFKVYFVPLNEAIKHIEDNIPKNEMNKAISPDMISAIKILLEK